MVDLLRVCNKFTVPTLEELSDKFVYFGEKKKKKLLILDMDETLIHARFLADPADEKGDDGDFFVTIASKSDETEAVKISVKMRQFLDNCLEHLETMYEICVFLLLVNSHTLMLSLTI